MPDADDAQNLPSTADSELKAIQDTMTALKSINAEARRRVVAYVFERLGLTVPAGVPPLSTNPGSTAPPPLQPLAPANPPTDVRSLKDQKQPRSSTEMAALVAYYLAEAAPLADRKVEITTADIEKYFKQANYRLPGRARKTLFDAKNAGYLDAGTDRGTYRLNPVGHNLIAHSLPAAAGAGAKKPSARKNTKAGKAAKRAPRGKGKSMKGRRASRHK